MLYLVATPIGNMEDISLRALHTLRTVDFIASEDTRHTGMLLKRYEISKPQLAFHEHNEERAGARILELLEAGKNVAIVTDAGTPGIADPGYSIVQKVISAGFEFTMIPGATGLIMAVVLSGLPVHSFTFRGFPPRKPGPRKRFFGVDAVSPHTLVFYESPYRLEGFFKDALEVYGDRRAALANDLTKMFEKVERGSISELMALAAGKPAKGEYIVVIEGKNEGRGKREEGREKREEGREGENDDNGKKEWETGREGEREKEDGGTGRRGDWEKLESESEIDEDAHGE
jgi:16S rRNA (cytidine1402-2'-O)-methyltransferase